MNKFLAVIVIVFRN